MLTHLCAGGNTTLCCNTTPDRLPIGDLLDEDPALTTCAGPVLDVSDTVNAKRFPPVPFRLGNGWELERGGMHLDPAQIPTTLMEPSMEAGHPPWPVMSEQSTTACCPRQTIPDSCSCLGCGCMCLDCDCENWGEEYDDAGT